MEPPVNQFTRRTLLGSAALAGVGAKPSEAARPNHQFRYCFNTSTIRGQNLPLVQELELIARAGYSGVEPWLREIDQYVQGGGVLKDLTKRLRDLGLALESAIGFAEWIVDDEARRAKGLETAKRDMDAVAQLGGKYFAAPPAGATDRADLSVIVIAERYHALLELGAQMSVTPMLEVWGFSKSLTTLSAAAAVAVACGHRDACILGDVYHFHKGGSPAAGLLLLNGARIPAIHLNDYPADPPRATITDAHRVLPGDGVAPMTEILRNLKTIGFRGALSLELFNRDLWKLDPLSVASTGLEKMKAVVAKAEA